MNNDESERLAELKDLGTIVAVAQTATLMAMGIKAGMSPNLVLAHLEDMRKDAFWPLTKAAYEEILKTVLETLAWSPDSLEDSAHW
jgi:hypothetical protein